MDTLTLIQQAQSGDEQAMNDLLRTIRDHHMNQRIGRYRGRNVLVDDAQIESEFLLGCYRAIPKAKLDIGNPLHFILYKGGMAVISSMRQSIRRGVQAQCNDCGSTKATGFSRRRPVCAHCGSTDVKTRMITVRKSDLAEPGTQDDMLESWDRLSSTDLQHEQDLVFSQATHSIVIDEIRSRLSGRARELFDLMAVAEINRDSSPNYLKEIAARWGCSTASVSVILRKVRSVVGEYIDASDPEEDFEVGVAAA